MTPGICQAGGLVLPSSLHISCCCPLAVHTPLTNTRLGWFLVNSTWGTVHSWQIHGNDKRMHDHSTNLYTVMTSTFVQLSLTTRNTVLYSKIHSSWNLIHRLPFNHRDEISSSIQSVAYLQDMIQLIFTILISLVTVPSAEIRPALGKHTWVTVPSLSVIWILSAVQLYLQLVAIRLGWFLVNSTWQTD